jgi:dolichol-phosphate mannosyltransferase
LNHDTLTTRQAAPAGPSRGPVAETGQRTLAVVIPTFNEVDNVALLIERLDAALTGVAWEAVFVDDDSTDGTVAALHTICRQRGNVRLLHRIGRRGLSSAVVEGMLATTAPYMAVIDADLQHDETLLAGMLAVLDRGEADIVVGSRYLDGGGTGEWDARRAGMSRLATRLAQAVVGARLSDPMSGFFMLRRATFDAAVRNLSAQGYKILLDIIASQPAPPRIQELPYVFGVRRHGESKLDTLVALEYGQLLLDKTVGRFVPVRFVMFAAVGGLGVLVHMAVLALMLAAGVVFFSGQAIATVVAMSFNFFLNNWLTYRDRRLKGLRAVAYGLLSFYAVCGLGAVANVGIANVLFERDYAWWLSAIAGILVGVVWNFAATSVFTWGKK